MKKLLMISSAVLLISGATGAFAQTSGDNPGGRGVTSTGGPKGVTGKNTDGTKARPVGTTGQSRMKNGAAAGNSANSIGGPNSATSNQPNAVDNRTSGGAGGTGSSGGAAGGR